MVFRPETGTEKGGALGGQVSQAQASGLLGEVFEGVSIRDRSVGLTLIGG